MVQALNFVQTNPLSRMGSIARRLATRMPETTQAIFLAAAFFLALFVVTDIIRTVDETNRRISLFGAVAVSELSMREPGIAARALTAITRRYGPEFTTSLHANNGSVVITTAPRGTQEEWATVRTFSLHGPAAAGGLKSLSVRLNHAALLTGPAIHATVALLLVIGACYLLALFGKRARPQFTTETQVEALDADPLARQFYEEKLQAEAASRSKTAFLAHLSHDIRTPLNHIIGFADLMRHQTYGPLGNARYLEYLETIKVSGEKLLCTFASILELAELEGGRKVMSEESVSTEDLIASIGQRYSAATKRAGLQFDVSADTRAMLWADRFCLERMIGNLLDNSLRFTPRGGRIALAAFASTDGVVIEVSDTGLGMDSEQLTMLSQPFVLGDAAFARRHGGLGLGIALARAIAQASGGRLVIDSTPALGTSVAIWLPARKAEHTTQAAA